MGQVLKISPNASNSEVLLTIQTQVNAIKTLPDIEDTSGFEQLFKTVRLTKGDLIMFKMRPIKSTIFANLKLSYLDVANSAKWGQ